MSTTESISETLKSSLSACSKVGYEADVSSDSDSSEQGSCDMSLDSEYLESHDNQKKSTCLPTSTGISNTAKLMLDLNEQKSVEKSAIWVAKLYKDTTYDESASGESASSKSVDDDLVGDEKTSNESVSDESVGDEKTSNESVSNELITDSEIEVDQLVGAENDDGSSDDDNNSMLSASVSNVVTSAQPTTTALHAPIHNSTTGGSGSSNLTTVYSSPSSRYVPYQRPGVRPGNWRRGK
ncbi:hypothetical protein FRC09_002030 [Ceratobasidium sp. 395]|nr:hypothetical protein FRC09_002030 [Ceratobasidium sp. 395]